MHRSVVMWGIVIMAGIGAAVWAAPMPAHAATLGTANTVALKSGLVGHWSLDGDKTNWASNTTQDSSGNGYTGTLVSMSTTTSAVPGKVGGALQFDASATNIIMSNTTSFSSITSGSVSAWARPESETSGRVVWGMRQGSAGQNNRQLSIAAENQGNGTFKVSATAVDTAGSTLFVSMTNNTFPYGKWYHIVYTSTSGSGNHTVYVNGVPQQMTVSVGSATDAFFSRVAVTDDTFQIGAKADMNGNYQGPFRGVIDDVRVYNRALSATEVALLAALGSAKVGSASIAPTGWSLGLSAGLVGHWTLDSDRTNWSSNTTRDSSGSGNTGTLVSMSTSTSPTLGKIGGALKFDGSTQYIDVGNPGSLQITSRITMAGWFKAAFPVPQGSSTYYPIVSKGYDTSTTGYELHFQNSAGTGNVPQLVCGSYSSPVPHRTSYTYGRELVDGRWHHAACVFDGSAWRLYVDGVQIAMTSETEGAQSATRKVMVGGFDDVIGGVYKFQGSLDDVRIYNRALSAQEVQQLYKLGQVTVGQAGLDANGKTLTLSSGLVGHWTLDGDRTNWATNTTRDSSGSGNTGTLVSMSTSTSPTLGKIGGALKFDGSTQYIDVGNPGSLQITSRITLAGWFKARFAVPAANGSYYAIVARGYDGVNTGYQLNFQNDGSTGNVPQLLCASWNGTSHGAGYTYGTSFANGAWNHAACVHDGSAWRLYVNGVQVAMSVDSTGPQSTSKGVLIGAIDANGNVHEFNGSLDDVRVYNRALSAQEIQQLYRMGGSR